MLCVEFISFFIFVLKIIRTMNQKKICIVGAGGFGREILCSFKEDFIAAGISLENIVFMDDSPDFLGSSVLNIPVISFKDFDSNKYEVLIAVGDPKTRKKIVERFPSETTYITLMHSHSTMMDLSSIGEGSVVTTGSILTTNITIGKHAHINLNSTIGHDCVIGDFFTTAPGVNISGECIIGDCVYMGTNASIRNGISICDNVTIGMGAVVTKSITQEGVYVGNPLRRLEI